VYSIQITNKFQKDYTRICKRKLDISILDDAVEILEKNGNLPSKFKPHKLVGNFKNTWEAHLKADWLLLWVLDEVSKTITLIGTGSHSDLFKS